MVLITLQPLTGLVHHNHYRKHGVRNAVGHSHIWFGRVMLVLGVINGGLGLQLASSSMTWIVAYSVVAGVMTVAYVAALVFKKVRGSRAVKGGYQESSSSPSVENDKAVHERR